MNKLYIDLATELGFMVSRENKYLCSGVIDISKKPEQIIYVSSTKRKTLPLKDANVFTSIANAIKHFEEDKTYIQKEDGYYYLVKSKTRIAKLNRKEQFKQFKKFIAKIIKDFEIEEITLEAPAVPKGIVNIKTLRKQFGLYSILETSTDLSIEEVEPNKWFKYAIDKYPHLKIWKEGKIDKKVDRKATSIAIASYIMEQDINNDNEADAINIWNYKKNN